MKALDIEMVKKDASSLSGTHLNICAILNQLGKHEKALKHAEVAIRLLDS